MKDYTAMTRTEAIKNDGIVGEVNWLKANAINIDASVINEALEADILSEEDYDHIIHARARRLLNSECIHPGVFANGPVPGTEYCPLCDRHIERTEL